MQKEKKVRAYTRKTKSGKTVSVKAHTAKYDAAEEARKAFAKKRGAGDELVKTKEVVKEKVEDNGLGFTADEYKAWYHWDMVDDPKNEAALRVKKALTKKMGVKGYTAYEKEMSDKWSARGHAKAYAALNKNAVADKTPKSLSGSANLSKEELAQLRNYYATDVKAHKRGVYVYTTMDEGEKKTTTAAQLRKMMRDFDEKPATREAMVAAKANKLAKKDRDFVRTTASKAKTKTIKVGGKPYYIWKDADGSFRGSHENPASRIINSNGIAKFSYDQGFKSFKDVEDYLKKYSK